MSKRAPSAVVFPVRRATWPSTPSSASATPATATRAGVLTGWAKEVTTRAVTPPTSTARARVTVFAGPRAVIPARCSPAPSRPQSTRPYAAPAARPAGVSPSVSARAASRRTWAARPNIGPRVGAVGVAASVTMPPVQDRLRMVAAVSALHALRRRSVQQLRRQPMSGDARAFWLASPGRGEIRPERVPAPARDEVQIRTLHTGVSRGTETLVFTGRVPASQWPHMRAPFQEGDFPAPVKYGYLNVGVVERGPDDLVGRTVFSLYPHQTRFNVPAGAVTVVP